jgi:hypothetical protein
VRANSRLPNPTFLTKFLNQDLQLARDFECEASLVPANFASYEKLLAMTRLRAATLIIDPVTHAFSYRGYSEKPTFTGLPYAPAAPLEAATFRDQARVRDFVESVLRFEGQTGADILVAPYLYTRDMDDGRLAANNRMIAEALRFPREDRRLYAMVCVAGSVLESTVQTQDLIRQYREPEVDGYLVMVENFDVRQAPTDMLMGMAKLVQGLSHERDVVVCSIAAYGQVMTALGANGFSAGVGWLETFRESNLQPGRTGFPADRAHRSQFYYVPELLSYLHPDAVQAVFGDGGSETAREYLCHCPVCAGALPKDAADKKRHFMHRRQQEMTELSQVALDRRLAHIRDRLGLALELAAAIEEEALIRVPTEHFVRWIAVIDGLTGPEGAAREPQGPGPEDLDRLIEEGRRARGADAPRRN